MEKIKILCVEDEMLVADLISSLLDKKVYYFMHISDGKEALDYLVKTNEPPDIVLLDYILPSMNGIDILKGLKCAQKKYAVIFLSAMDSIEMAVEALREGAIEYLAKNNNLKNELNIKVGKAFKLFQVKRKTEYFERTLQEKTEELSHFFSAVPDLLCIIDAKGNFKRLNEAWETTLGYSINEMIDKPYIKFVHEDDVKSTTFAAQKLIKNGKLRNFVNRYRCKDKTYKYIEWSCVSDKNSSFYCSASDITERRITEQALKDSESRFRSMIETANVGIAIIGINDFMLMTNKVLQDLLEYDRMEFRKINVFDLIYTDDLEQFTIHHKKLNNSDIGRYNIQIRLYSKSGKTLWFDLAVSPVKNDSNKIIYFVAVFNDITDRKYYEQQLIDINSTKDKFFSIIGHDLRNQFSSIGLITEFLMEKDYLNEAKKENYLSLLHLTGTSALTLLENLMEWSRTQINKVELNIEENKLLNLVKDVLLTVQNQAVLKEINISTQISEKMKILCDKHMLSTILRNLINNAIKFTEPHGQILISADYQNGNYIISVKDNGIGIPKDIADQLFKNAIQKTTLGTRKEKGTGLGLILCKEFIEMHKGKITVESEIGKGSEFKIFIPQN